MTRLGPAAQGFYGQLSSINRNEIVTIVIVDQSSSA